MPKTKSFPRTFVNVFDEPKRKGIPERHVEHTTDIVKSNKNFDAAASDYAHRIGAVVTTQAELDEYLKAPKKSRKAPPKKTTTEPQEPQGQASVPEPTVPS